MASKKSSKVGVRGFYDLLKDELEDYNDEFKEYIRLAPELFRLFTTLFSDPDIPQNSKRLIAAVIAYFVAPMDAIPEESTGSWGYLDDVFLCAWALKKLEKDVGYDVLVKNWRGEGDLKEVVEEIYEKAGSWLKGMEESIIKNAGLSKSDFKGIK